MILDITLSKIALLIEDKMSVNMFIYTILLCDCAQIEAKKGNNNNKDLGNTNRKLYSSPT